MSTSEKIQAVIDGQLKLTPELLQTLLKEVKQLEASRIEIVKETWLNAAEAIKDLGEKL